jgi:hypothetical protein
MLNLRNVKTVALVAVLAMTFLGSSIVVSADQWFDSYGSLTRNDELAHFANLAVYMRDHPEVIGYIAFCRGPRDRNSDLMRRKTHGVDFIVARFKIPRSQLKIINYGHCHETMTILQPMDKSKPVPKFF